MKSIVFIFILMGSSFSFADFNLTVEAGASWQTRNDIRIPNSQDGSRFDLSDIKRGPFFHHRFESLFTLKGRHHLRVVYAPLSLSVKGGFNRTIEYNDVTFSAADEIQADYVFNSYRLGYVYKWVNREKHKIYAGFTLKLRQADIRLSQSNTSANYDNLGFVPLLYLAYEYRFFEEWSFFSDADFAAASQGRAFDVALKLRHRLNDNYSLGFGYRFLEGGADNDEVFTFSFFHYGVFDLLVNF